MTGITVNAGQRAGIMTLSDFVCRDFDPIPFLLPQPRDYTASNRGWNSPITAMALRSRDVRRTINGEFSGLWTNGWVRDGINDGLLVCIG